MTTPSTANAEDHGDHQPPARPVVERGAKGSGATHSVVDGEVAPRLPHERDESSDSGTGQPSEVMEKAAGDAQQGHADQPRGPDTQKNYSDLTEKAAKPA